MSTEKPIMGDKVFSVSELQIFFPAGTCETICSREIARAFAEEIGLDKVRAFQLETLAANLAYIAWKRGLERCVEIIREEVK